MIGWIKTALSLGLRMFGILTGKDKPRMTDALPFVLANLLPAVEKAIEYKGLSTQAKFDSWLATLDTGTGSDLDAADFFPNLPPNREEELFDHLIEAARIYGYCLLKVDGYYQ